MAASIGFRSSAVNRTDIPGTLDSDLALHGRPAERFFIYVIQISLDLNILLYYKYVQNKLSYGKQSFNRKEGPDRFKPGGERIDLRD